MRHTRLLLAAVVVVSAGPGLAGASVAVTHRFGPSGIRVEFSRGQNDSFAFGNSVALSTDGSVGLIGDAAAATVVTRSRAGWTKQAELVLPGVDPMSSSGAAVALSGDGATAIVGGGQYATAAMWVFVRRGTTWSPQAKLTAPGIGSLGHAVALSADGDVALASGRSTAWVFTRNGSTWSKAVPLIGSGHKKGPLIGYPDYGSSVALSGDGRTAIVGDDYDADNGAAWVFVRSAAGWRQQGAKLVAPESQIRFGSAAALSVDGSTAVIGADGGGGGVYGDSAWIFTRSGTTWTQRAELDGFPVTVRGRPQDWSQFGGSVAITGDGGIVLVGASSDSGGTGAAIVFTRKGSSWGRAPDRLVPGKTRGDLAFGTGVGLSADGSTALVGAPQEGSGGAAWFFTRSSQGGSGESEPGPLPAGATSWRVDGGVKAIAISGTLIAYQGNFDCGVHVRRASGGTVADIASPTFGQYTTCDGFGGGQLASTAIRDDLAARSDLGLDGKSVLWLDRIDIGTSLGVPGGSTLQVVLVRASLDGLIPATILARGIRCVDRGCDGGYFSGLVGGGVLALDRLTLRGGVITQSSLDTVSEGHLTEVASGRAALFAETADAGRVATVGEDGTIRIYSSTGRILTTVASQALLPRSIALSGATLAAIGRGNTLAVYSAGTGKLERRIGLAVGADNLAVSGDRAAYVARNRTVHMLDLRTGRDTRITTTRGNIIGLRLSQAALTYAWNDVGGAVGWVVSVPVH